MGRRLAAVVFWIGAALLGALTLLVFATGPGAGRLRNLLPMAVYAIGCAGCVVAGQSMLRPRVKR